PTPITTLPLHDALPICKNYGLWLYYHRLDRDTLSKALIDYAEPKLRLEENRLKELRSSRAEAGATGSAARSIDRKLEHQDELLSDRKSTRLNSSHQIIS